MKTANLKEILKAAQKLAGLRKLGPKAPWQVELHELGSEEMQELNRLYRGKDYATDVLSFPAPEVFRRQGLLGELVICRPVLKRQAKEQKHSERRELKILLVHGVLHLLGLEHEGRGSRAVSQAKAMAAWETKLLKALETRPPKGLIKRSQ